MSAQESDDFQQTLSTYAQARRATPRTLNFTNVADIWQHGTGRVRHRGHTTDMRPLTPDGKLLTPRQIRARARRRFARGMRSHQGAITKQEFEALYKPLDQWDLEELAHGRPRNSNGKFRGPAPSWITREVYEKAMEQFQLAIKSRMGVQGVTALNTLEFLLSDQAIDKRGRPMIPPSVKLQATTFLLDHIVGKPKQHVQQDISVRLQAVLGAVMANPNEALAPPSQGGRLGIEQGDEPGYTLAHYPGHTIPIGVEDAIDVEFDEEIDMSEESS
jgi:hypothetical protein